MILVTRPPNVRQIAAHIATNDAGSPLCEASAKEVCRGASTRRDDVQLGVVVEESMNNQGQYPVARGYLSIARCLKIMGNSLRLIQVLMRAYRHGPLPKAANPMQIRERRPVPWKRALLVLSSVVLFIACSRLNGDYRTANRDSSGLAPDPSTTAEAVAQVYAARAFNWRGIFAVHTWIATKEANAVDYNVLQVIGWRARRNLPVVLEYADLPDRNWFGSRPQVIAELRGAAAERAIEAIQEAVASYPYPETYGLWPGPNSNTFVAHILRNVPELRAAMPNTAIGKDFLTDGGIAGPAPSGTGYQLSIYGLLGLILARDEGVEVNLLGLNFGLDILRPALKLPFVGRLGVSRKTATGQ